MNTENLENELVENIVEKAYLAKEQNIRTGKLPDIPVPKQVVIIGNLDAPLRWLKSRKEIVDTLSTNIIVHRNEGTIILTENERFNDTASITGKLKLSEFFQKFEINTGFEWTAEKLADFIKMNRTCFLSVTESMKLVAELKNIRIKTDKEFEKANNNRGDTRSVIAQKVIESNIPETFRLRIPIFEGFGVVEFEVEIYVNANNFNCSLVSPEANDFINTQKDELIDKIIFEINEITPEIVVIQQ